MNLMAHSSQTEYRHVVCRYVWGPGVSYLTHAPLRTSCKLALGTHKCLQSAFFRRLKTTLYKETIT